MPSAAGDLWSAFLDALDRLLTPDWGDVIRWLPIAISVAVLAVLAMLARSWLRLLRAERAAGQRVPLARGRRRAAVSPPLAWALLIPLGVCLILAGLLSGPGLDASRGIEPVANLPLLLAGLATALGGAAVAVHVWERADEPGALDGWLASPLAAPATAARSVLGGLRVLHRREVLIPLGGVVAVAAFLAPTRDAGGGPGAVHLPVLLGGLLLMLGAVAASVRRWEQLDAGDAHAPALGSADGAGGPR